jgi:hypothetical protein
MTNSTKPKTVIEIMEAAMSDFSDAKIIDIIQTLEAKETTEDERIIKFAGHGVLEARYPQMVADLEARIDEDLTYTELVVDVLRNLNIIK